MRTQTMAVATLLACFTGGAFADASKTAELVIAGTIKPGSCVPTLDPPTGIKLDIMASTLKINEVNTLGDHDLTLNISCTAPMKVGMTLKFNSEPPKSTDNTASVDVAGGLGKVGWFQIVNNSQAPKIDGVAGEYLQSKGGKWQSAPFVKGNRFEKYSYASAINPGVPVAAKHFQSKFVVTAKALPAKEIENLGVENDLGGGASFEISYL